MHPDVDHGNICTGRNWGFSLGSSESSCLSAALPVCGGIPGKTRQKSKPAAQRIEGMSGIIKTVRGLCALQPCLIFEFAH